MVRKRKQPAESAPRRTVMILNSGHFHRNNRHISAGNPAEESLQDVYRHTDKFLAMLAQEVRKQLMAGEA